MNTFDFVAQLGSHVQYLKGQYKLAAHTDMRTRATALAFQNGLTPHLVICGGSNFGVRYDDEFIFGPNHATQKKAIFTFEALAGSDWKRLSEAAAIKRELVEKHSVPHDKVMTETLSATTLGNALLLKAMMEDRTDAFKGKTKLGLLTLLYHMSDAVTDKGRKPGALTTFRETFKDTDVVVEPVFAENLLVKYGGADQLEEVLKYYATPKGGYQWEVAYMAEMLRHGESLEAMMR